MICPACQASNDTAAQACARCGEALCTLTLGTVLSGRYEVLQVLGTGGMGVVYRAHDRELDETVALKVLRPYAGGDAAEAERRFHSEIKLARKVRHRNVCGIHEYGRDGPFQYIAMEYVPGVDLRHVIRERGCPGPAQAFEIAIQVARGLQAIHAEGIVHRDLKTSNLMQGADGAVRLMDFGIAKRFEGDITHATAAGFAVGTPEYMSPEQVRGQAVDARSDLYALGIVIFELFTGVPPFHGETPLATIYMQLQEPPPLDGPLGARIPPPVLPVLRRLLAKDRQQRFASAGEVIQALRTARAESSRGVTGGLRRSAAGEDDELDPPGARDTAAAGQGVTLPVTASTVAERVSTGQGASALVPGTRQGVATLSRSQRRLGAVATCVGAACAVAVLGFLGMRPAAKPLVSPAPSSSPGPSVRPSLSAPRVTEPRPVSDSGAQLAELDELARRDPRQALARAARLARGGATSEIQERVARYRLAALDAQLVTASRAMERAAASPGRQAYEAAQREYEAALELDPGNAIARTGRAAAAESLRKLGQPSAAVSNGATNAALGTVAFVQSETTFQGAEAAPVGMGPAPAGVVIHAADAPMPRAQLVIEAVPARVQVDEALVVRYYLFNTSAGRLAIGSVAVHNLLPGGAATGGEVEPLARSAAPKTRTLLLETRTVWSWDPSSDWSSALTVVLDDGSVYRTSLRTQR